jgi:predicted house-cleaning noncanonical NTP pyrophosphatase (MazG superfamily)
MVAYNKLEEVRLRKKEEKGGFNKRTILKGHKD